MSVFVPYTWHFAIFKSTIMEIELDVGGKHDKTDEGN